MKLYNVLHSVYILILYVYYIYIIESYAVVW